ncbi:MAG: NAD(P)/FAD-dependent oxidoreductase [Chloroflexi bacterium]|nr:NAD(P)/FAD-dependent oxidoreductase [Chloroflexota bacterium]
MKIGIIGAGVAGLTAAYDLSRAGHSVTVYESAPFIGGQASTIEVGASDGHSGGRLERGYHHLFTNDIDIIGLMEELGIAGSLQWFPSKVGTYVDGKIYRTTTPLDLLRFGALPIWDRVKLGLFALRVRRIKDWRPLEPFTADEWLRKKLGGKAYETVWNPLLRGKFGDYYDRVGMPWFWSKIQTRFASRKGAGGEKLGYPVKSFDEVLSALRDRLLAAGGSLHVETPVERVLTREGRASGLRFRRPDGTAAEESFDRVLATVPSFSFPQMVDLPDDYRARLEGVTYTAAVVLILEMTRPLTDYYWMNIADRSVPFLGLIEHTNMLPKEWYGGSHLLYLTNYVDRSEPLFSMTPDEVLELYLPHLRLFNPEFDRSWIKKTHYNSLSAAQPIIGTNYSQRIPDHRTPVPGLYLANTTQIYPEDRGTNYSVRMGRKVAKLLMEDAAAT